jgi:hypothetical protein
MKAPEKIYLYPYSTDGIYEVETKPLEGTVEYTRTDTFIEKAFEFFAPHIQDNSGGYDRAYIYEKFKKYMKGE